MKNYALVLVLMMCVSTLSGQDIIIKIDKSEIKAKVVEIQEEFIKYYLFESPEGPIRNIRISDVFMIIYANGSRETFGISNKVNGNENNENNVAVQTPLNTPTIVNEKYEKVQAENKESERLGFVFGGKAGYFIPYNQNIAEIYGSGFMGGLIVGYWGRGAGVEIDWRYYSKKGDPYVFGSVDAAEGEISISPLTITGYWDAYHKGNFSTYVGLGLGASFIKENLVMSAFGQTAYGSGSLTGFEFHSTGGLRFSPFYVEITFSSCTVQEIGFRDS